MYRYKDSKNNALPDGSLMERMLSFLHLSRASEAVIGEVLNLSNEFVVMEPSQKEVVLGLMTIESTNNRANELYVKCKFPRPECRIKSVSFRENSCFENPYTHLKACY